MSALPKPPPPKAPPGAKAPPPPAVKAAPPSPPGKPGLPPAPGRPSAPPPVSARPGAPAPVAARPGTPAAPARPGAARAAAPAVKITPRRRSAPLPEIFGLPQPLAGLAEAIRMLDSLIDEENCLLSVHDVAGIEALQDRKQTASRYYVERLRAVLQHQPDGFTLADPRKRDQLKALAAAMEAKSRENVVLLKAHMDAHERVMSIINDAVCKQKNPDMIYSNRGKITGAMTTASAALALDKSV